MTEPLPTALLATLPASQRQLFLRAYEQARTDGLCHEGALELAYEAVPTTLASKNQTTHNIQTEPTNPNTITPT